ncbi:endonuclease VII domain-containing protein [Streptomyces sp. NPDC058471]|uniref:endonuclease VII domain-containing protein n=1 Tax=Streptomyces sp. NPDC058471 TaxID=3346516 RepID=UPI00364ADE91
MVKARKAADHEKRVIDTYGLKKGEYAKLYTFQGGVCALCRRATGASRRLSVDHDHRTGEVRGLLCRPCNTLLGHARDNISFFKRCAGYLGLSPYAAMKQGWEAWYEDE